jgi:hypothetical protein
VGVMNIENNPTRAKIGVSRHAALRGGTLKA